MGLELTCPAADPIASEGSGLPSCICGVIRNANCGESIAGYSARGEVNPTVAAAENPSSIRAFCAGQYVECPVWQAEKERIWAGRSVKGGLHSSAHRERNPGADAVLETMMSGMRSPALDPSG